MPTKEEFIKTVDALMGAEKVLVTGYDLIEWVEGRDSTLEKCIKFPLEVGGVQSGARLELIAFPYHEILKFSISIIFGTSICRLDFDDSDTHQNNLRTPQDNIPLLIQGTHFHSWELNRRLVVSPAALLKLKNAEPITNLRAFMPSLRWFFKRTNIVFPFDLSIDLPEKEKLL